MEPVWTGGLCSDVVETCGEFALRRHLTCSEGTYCGPTTHCPLLADMF